MYYAYQLADGQLTGLSTKLVSLFDESPSWTAAVQRLLTVAYPENEVATDLLATLPDELFSLDAISQSRREEKSQQWEDLFAVLAADPLDTDTRKHLLDYFTNCNRPDLTSQVEEAFSDLDGRPEALDFALRCSERLNNGPRRPVPEIPVRCWNRNVPKKMVASLTC